MGRAVKGRPASDTPLVCLHDLPSGLLDVELVVPGRVLVVDCLLDSLVGGFLLLCLFVLLLLLLLLGVVLDVLVPLWAGVVLFLGLLILVGCVCVFGRGRRGGEAVGWRRERGRQSGQVAPAVQTHMVPCHDSDSTH